MAHTMFQIQSMSHFMSVMSNQIHRNNNPELPCLEELWYAGYSYTGDVNSDGNAHATDFNALGHLVGRTWCLDGESSLGVFYNYERQDSRAEEVRSHIESDSHRMRLYLISERDDFYGTFTAFGGFNDFDSTRNVSVNMISEQNLGDFDGWSSAVNFESGWTYEEDDFLVQPFMGLQWMQLTTDGFQETGGDITALALQKMNINSVRTQVGGRAKIFALEDRFSMDVEASWLHELQDYEEEYSAGLVSTPGQRFLARGVNMGNDWLNVGPSMNLSLGPVDLFLKYQASIGEEGTLHSGQWGSEMTW
jgi:outer membrane autotransporter protein